MMSLKRFFSRFEPKTAFRVIDFLGFWGLLKVLEIKLLGRYASTYCINSPRILYIQTTNRCQLQCKYCTRMDRHLINPAQEMMSYEDFVRVAKQIKKVRRLYLYGGDEPLLHKDIIRMIQFLKENKKARSLGILTNGMLLTPDIADRLLSTGVDRIGISLDGSDAETNNAIRVGSNFPMIVDNIRYIARKEDAEKQIEVYSVLSTENLKSLENMPELLHDLGVRYYRIQQMAVRFDKIRDFRPPGFPHELQQLLKEKCKKYGIDFHYYPRTAKTICLDPFIFCLITCDGKISPCCNIKTQGLNTEPFQFKGFWNGPAIRAWRQKMLDRDYPPVCIKNCDIVGVEQIKT